MLNLAIGIVIGAVFAPFWVKVGTYVKKTYTDLTKS